MAAVAADPIRTAAAEADAILAAAKGKAPALRDAIRRAHLALWTPLEQDRTRRVPAGYALALGCCSFTPASPAALRDRIRHIRNQLAEVGR
jgi:hypothetical protein